MTGFWDMVFTRFSGCRDSFTHGWTVQNGLGIIFQQWHKNRFHTLMMVTQQTAANWLGDEYCSRRHSTSSQWLITVNAGCYTSTVCCSIFLYADDILLIAPTVSGLQAMLTACEKELIDIDMCINVNRLYLNVFVLARDLWCPVRQSDKVRPDFSQNSRDHRRLLLIYSWCFWSVLLTGCRRRIRGSPECIFYVLI